MNVRILKTDSNTKEMITSIKQEKGDIIYPLEINIITSKILPENEVGSVLLNEDSHRIYAIKAKMSKSSDIMESIIQYNMREILDDISDKIMDKSLAIVLSYNDLYDDEDMFKFIYATKIALRDFYVPIREYFTSQNVDVSIIITDYEV